MSETKAKWMQLMTGCVSAFVREQIGSPCPVVDYELRADAAEVPDDMRVWFICRTENEKDEFKATERSRGISVFKKRMIAAGFPDSALASVEIKVTSREEIEKAGGNSYFLR